MWNQQVQKCIRWIQMAFSLHEGCPCAEAITKHSKCTVFHGKGKRVLWRPSDGGIYRNILKKHAIITLSGWSDVCRLPVLKARKHVKIELNKYIAFCLQDSVDSSISAGGVWLGSLLPTSCVPEAFWASPLVYKWKTLTMDLSLESLETSLARVLGGNASIRVSTYTYIYIYILNHMLLLQTHGANDCVVWLLDVDLLY